MRPCTLKRNSGWGRKRKTRFSLFPGHSRLEFPRLSTPNSLNHRLTLSFQPHSAQFSRIGSGFSIYSFRKPVCYSFIYIRYVMSNLLCCSCCRSTVSARTAWKSKHPILLPQGLPSHPYHTLIPLTHSTSDRLSNRIQCSPRWSQ